jgi:hypothetical protein
MDEQRTLLCLLYLMVADFDKALNDPVKRIYIIIPDNNVMLNILYRFRLNGLFGLPFGSRIDVHRYKNNDYISVAETGFAISGWLAIKNSSARRQPPLTLYCVSQKDS